MGRKLPWTSKMWSTLRSNSGFNFSRVGMSWFWIIRYIWKMMCTLINQCLHQDAENISKICFGIDKYVWRAEISQALESQAIMATLLFAACGIMSLGGAPFVFGSAIYIVARVAMSNRWRRAGRSKVLLQSWTSTRVLLNYMSSMPDGLIEH